MAITLAKDAILFIDDSTLLTQEMYTFLKTHLNGSQTGNTLFVVEKSITKHIDNLKKMHAHKDAYYIEGLLDILNTLKLTTYIDTKNYFESKHILETFKKYPNHQAIIMTQKETVFQNLSQNYQKTDAHIFAKFDSNHLAEWTITAKKSNKAFYVAKDDYVNPIDTTDVTHVYTPKYGHLRLDKSEIYTGGEGSIYRTYNHLMCKLYNTDHITYTNMKKLMMMLELDVMNPFINWPKDLLYVQNDFVGYVMDEIHHSRPLDELRIEGFKGYKLIDRYYMAYHFLKNVYYLHKKNIVIGDLKLDNILVKSSQEVFLIDCGSYQISDYPCTVFHPEFTNKNYTVDELKKNLRSVEDEYYAINKIIFLILIGKNPNFNRADTEIDEENKYTFAYPLDVSKGITEKSPQDLRLWMMLSPKMRDMFYYYFKEKKVSYLPEWIDEFKLYIDLIETNLGGKN